MNLLNIMSFKDLLVDVQMQHVFEDQKTFVDSIPKHSVEEILSKYHTSKDRDDFNLKHFISENFETPKPLNENFTTNPSQNIAEHINQLWNILTRTSHEEYSTLIPLPDPFVVPGGRFGEIYYWDSYFTMLGLKVAGRMDLIQYMVDNFTYLIETIGHIPNGNRSYFLSRSQPPFYSHMVQLLKQEKGNEILKKYLPTLLKEYSFWMGGSNDLSDSQTAIKRVVLMDGGEVLNRYWDAENTPRPEGYAIDMCIYKTAKNNPELFRNIRAACESGWDFSSRWFSDSENITTICTTEIIPVDLNCLLWHMENTIAEAFEINGDMVQQKIYTQKATHRKAAINKYLWNPVKSIYNDYNFRLKQPTLSIHLAMAYPLFMGIADTYQANSVLEFIRNNFSAPGGLLTTTVETSQQWDSPKGWAPLQWIAYKSAVNYNHLSFADEIKNNWCSTIEKTFSETGKLLEKYIVTNDINKKGGGEYPNQDGFGWTNAIYTVFNEEKFKYLDKVL